MVRLANPTLNLDRWMAINGYKYTTGGIRKFGVVTESPAEFDIFLKVKVIFDSPGGHNIYTKEKKYNLGKLHMCTLEKRTTRYNVNTVIKTIKGTDVYFSEFEGTLGGNKELLG